MKKDENYGIINAGSLADASLGLRPLRPLCACVIDGCDCEETLKLIAEGKLNTEPLITHTYPLERIEYAYELFENKRDGVVKVAVERCI